VGRAGLDLAGYGPWRVQVNNVTSIITLSQATGAANWGRIMPRAVLMTRNAPKRFPRSPGWAAGAIWNIHFRTWRKRGGRPTTVLALCGAPGVSGAPVRLGRDARRNQILGSFLRDRPTCIVRVEASFSYPKAFSVEQAEYPTSAPFSEFL